MTLKHMFSFGQVACYHTVSSHEMKAKWEAVKEALGYKSYHRMWDEFIDKRIAEMDSIERSDYERLFEAHMIREMNAYKRWREKDAKREIDKKLRR